MLLYRRSDWFNPFFILVNAKRYEVKDIHFFDKEGIICSTSRGWFGDGGSNPFSVGVELDVDCVLKKKIDFNLKTAFIISSGKDPYDDSLNAVLYIPASSVGLNDPIIKNKTSSYYIVRWNTDLENVYCYRYHYINNSLNKVESKIRAVGEKIGNLYTDQSFNDLPLCIKVLSDLQEERMVELEKIAQIKDEDVLANYRGISK